MAEKRKLLIVEDSRMNRAILHGILEKEYEILEAVNGQEALDILTAYGDQISLILLDINMPVMDGYEFMDILRTRQELSGIPVIVTTSRDNEQDEICSLTKGASDFVAKPYSPEVVRHRVASIIRLRESAAFLNALEFDPLTGLYSKEFFYRQVARRLADNPEKQYDIICSDVENFKLVNERLGVEKGDELLRYIAKVFTFTKKEDDICGRIGADLFAVLVEHKEGYYKRQFEEDLLAGYPQSPVSNIVIKYGVYENVDRSIPVSGMCDRAVLALRRIKHQYGRFISVYDDSLRLKLLREQQIVDNMEQALSESQFEVYYQPKYDIMTDRISGAEALVRWNHPEFGFMPPGEFIPLFERNGFVTKLDFYVWKEVCRSLRKWKEEGLPLVPVSVNISRMDFGMPDLAKRIKTMADRYGVDHELLHLEVTESSYTDNPQQIIDVVNELRTMGFKIEMDDFGSGYSSLNMLSELSIDILKLDMRLVQQDVSRQKKSILSFILSLSKWLELDTIAEGVETSEQVERLRNMGCKYVQGFFYAKPMPTAEFREYLLRAGEDQA